MSNFIGVPVVPPVVATPPNLRLGCGGTWLPLDRWAEIIGINPFHFHQLTSSTLIPNTVCGDAFFQFAWQHSDRVGRDEICMAIKQAEYDISLVAGFNLMPDWTVDERLSYPRPAFPESYNLYGTNPRGMYKSVETPRGYLISGGIKTKVLVDDEVAIVRSDLDGDGFDETCAVAVAVSFTDINQIHVYYPGQDGDDAWEIRPIKVSITAGVATITFKVWQVALATAMMQADPEPLDADDPASYQTTVDVYRIYNDVSQQISFLWENDPSINCCGSCYACQLGAQTGCMHFRDPRLGILVPSPADWNAGASEFTATEFTACREPDQVRLWYYSGYKDNSISRPYAELSPIWEYAIAYYAASKLDRPVCGCSNVNQFIDKWRRDSSYSSLQEGGFTVTAELAANRLGTSMGALYAYRVVQKMKINK